LDDLHPPTQVGIKGIRNYQLLKEEVMTVVTKRANEMDTTSDLSEDDDDSCMQFVSGYSPARGYETTHEIRGREVRSTRSGRRLKVTRAGRVLMYDGQERRRWENVEELMCADMRAPTPIATTASRTATSAFKWMHYAVFLAIIVATVTHLAATSSNPPDLLFLSTEQMRKWLWRW
jgi:hypothetical protein